MGLPERSLKAEVEIWRGGLHFSQCLEPSEQLRVCFSSPINRVFRGGGQLTRGCVVLSVL